jgi:hypothetical protein
VIARNYIGFGTPSLKIYILASQIPDPPESVVATATYNSYQVSWAVPNSQGSPILYYTVYADEDGDNVDDFVEVATTTNTFYNVADGVI